MIHKTNAKKVEEESAKRVRPIIKSRRRVVERSEVFTQPREVDRMLALTQATSNRYWRFLEPSCGNGNFLEAIVRQRLDHLKQDQLEWNVKNREFSVLKVLSTIYGVDIAEDNIAECRSRLAGVVFEYLPKKMQKGFLLSLNEILRTNCIVGDMMNGTDKIFFVEYTTPVKGKFKRKVYALDDMQNGVERVILELPLVNYDELTPVPNTSIRLKVTEAVSDELARLEVDRLHEERV